MISVYCGIMPEIRPSKETKPPQKKDHPRNDTSPEIIPRQISDRPKSKTIPEIRPLQK